MTDPRRLDAREDRAWRSLMAMQGGLSEFLERQLRNRSALSYADFQVLTYLSEAEGGRLRQFELGRLLHWEKSRLSQHLSRMQGRGLTTRETSLSDLRGMVVTITAKGLGLVEQEAGAHLADVRAAIVDHLSPAELDTLTVIGEKVSQRLAELETLQPEHF